MRPILIITGATGTGKSCLAQALARLFGTHIISIDALKVYRGMDVGTDKPPLSVRAEIPHHMLDVVEPSERYSAARYVEDVERVLEELRRRRERFLFEGGTVLYIKALTEGLFKGVPCDDAVRAELEEQAERYGLRRLYERLMGVDAAAAARIHPNDKRRIIRALEVFLTTGRRISDLQRQFGKVSLARRIVVLWRGRDELRRLLSERVRRMFEGGLVEEVERLLSGGGLGATASQAAGYAEVAAFLAGRIGLEEAQRRTFVRHWHLARRQMVWLKRFTDAIHICFRGDVNWEDMARRFSTWLRGTTLDGAHP